MADAILSTARLDFRPFRRGDEADLADLQSDPDVARFLGGAWDARKVREKLEQFGAEHAERGHSKWRVSLKDGTFVGRAGVAFYPPTGELELGYGLKQSFWGQGLATEAARAVAQHAFQVTDVAHIIGFTHPENAASQHVLRKIGMTYEGIQDIGGSRPYALYRLTRP